MKPRCINCHFLVKKANQNGVAETEGISWEERQKMRTDECQLEGVEAFACYMKVWDERVDLGLKDRVENIIKTDRDGRCFYLDYKPNLSFETAVELQKNKNNGQSQTLALLGERAWLIWIISALVFTFSIIYTHLQVF